MLNNVFNRRIFSKGRRFYHGMTGGEIVYNKLIQYNIKDVWISTGGAVMPLVDAFYKGNINYYLPSHEQSGGHCAAGYAKVTGKPGISIVTSGPGFTNSLTALTDAMNDSVPFILMSGQVPLQAMGTQAFQECPSVDISRPVTKWSVCVDNVNDLPSIIDKAFKVATSGKPGAVHIDLPKCVTSNKLEKINNIELEDSNNIKNFLTKSDKTMLTELIKKSKKPVLLAGQGCNSSWNKLRRFSKITNIPVTTTIHAMGCFDETNELSLQFLGMHGNGAANHAIQNADLIIAVGTRFDDRITGNIKTFAPKAFEAFKRNEGGIIHVNINSDEIDYVIKSHFNFNMDAFNFFDQLNPHLEKLDKQEWLEIIKKWQDEYKFKYSKSNNLKTQQVIEALNNYLLDNNISKYYISTGVGNHQMMASQFIKWKYPKSFLTSGSLGTMGVGLPYAIGAQIAKPDSLVIDIDGDGSFNHSLHELKALSDYNLPVKIFIMNDSKLSMVKAWEKLFYDERYTATDLKRNPDYSKLAESFGIKGVVCDSEENLFETINFALNYKGPIICDFKVEGDLCLPLVAPGKAIDDMILHKDNIEAFDSNVLPPG